MGPSAASQLLNREGGFTPELTSDFQTIVAETHSRVVDLFTAASANISVPELQSPEFSQINWAHLQEGFRIYESLGMQPELVISPEGQPLSFWKTLYSGLRVWQDRTQPDAPHRLLKRDDGDGLYIDSQLEARWDELIPNQSRWSVSVLPGTPKPPVLNTAYDGTNAKQAMPIELTNILQSLSLTDTNSQKLRNPKLEKYLHLQATRIQLGQGPLDIEVFSWLNGTFTKANGKLAAPDGSWDPGYGQVSLDWNEVVGRHDNLGVRPEVRDVVL